MVKLDFFKGKKIFITGNTGFKGSWLSEILLLAGANIEGYSLPPIGSLNLFGLLGLNERMKTTFADVRDLVTLKNAVAAFQPEIVIHMAAQPLVRESYKNPIETYSVNVMGTVNLLEACRNVAGLKSVLNVTTDKVYENKEWAWGYRENENLCGYDPYSNSKSCSELVTFSYKNSFYSCEDAPAISTARSGNVIGGGDFSEDRIIPDCYRSAAAGKTIVVRNPYSVRPYQHCMDCLSGYLTIMKVQYENSKQAGNYNFGPSESDCVSTGELVDKFCALWQNIGWIDRFDGGPHEASFLKLDISKAKAELDWTPTWGIDAALSATVEWYKVLSENAEEIRAITDRQIKEFFGL